MWILLFIEGILTFISPCFLPMLPVYLSYFSSGHDSPRKTLANALAFVLGFTVIFVTLGLSASRLSQFLLDHRLLIQRVGGVLMVLLGLNQLGWLSLPGKRQAAYQEPPKGFLETFFFGMIIAFSWSPCLSIFLMAALLQAASQGSILEGGLKLLVFSLGLGLPFLISALLLNNLSSALNFFKRHQKTLRRISGILVIAFGLLMAMDRLLWYAGLFY